MQKTTVAACPRSQALTLPELFLLSPGSGSPFSSPINFIVCSAFPFQPAIACWMSQTRSAKVRNGLLKKAVKAQAVMPGAQHLCRKRSTKGWRLQSVTLPYPGLPYYHRPNSPRKRMTIFWVILTAWLLWGYFFSSQFTLPITYSSCPVATGENPLCITAMISPFCSIILSQTSKAFFEDKAKFVIRKREIIP